MIGFMVYEDKIGKGLLVWYFDNFINFMMVLLELIMLEVFMMFWVCFII